MDTGDILFERQGRLGLVTLNRPAALNALTLEMTRALDRRLRDWSVDDAIGAVAVRGAGDRAFCAGGDIRQLYDLGEAGRYDEAVEFWREEYVLNALIHFYPKPYVALIRGFVMGGGVGLAIHGSHRVGLGRIGFAMPEVGIGFFPDIGATYFLPRLPGRTGLWLGLTGARIDAPDALRLGLLTHALPAEAGDAAIAALAGGASPQEALSGPSISPPAPLEPILPAITRLFSGASIEAILADLDAESEGPAAAFAAEAARSMRAKSPTSLKLAFQTYRRGDTLDFAEAMRTEFRVASRVVRFPDFYEGVRATVIERGSVPHWRPASLGEVRGVDIEACFGPLGERELQLG